MLLAALAAAVLAAPQEAPKGCRRCDHRGVVGCPRHTAEERAAEAEVLHCSVAARCPECAGALLVDCPRCDGGPESALMAQRRADAAAWLAVEDPLEALLRRPLARAETAHFRLIVDAPESLRDGKKKVDGHGFLHLVARDLERVAALQDGHFGAKPSDRRSPARMWFWERRDDHAAVMLKYLYSTSAGDFKLLGRDPVFSVWTADPTFESSAPRLHALGIHNGAHMLLSNLFQELWIGDLGAGWLDEGAAHWTEEKVLGRSDNYCVDETGIPEGGVPVVERAAVRERLRKGKEPVLPGLLRRQTGELTAEEHALAWSFYDWIAAEHPAALAPLLRGCQEKRPAGELLPEALDLSLYAAEEAWRAWVSEHYPPLQPKPRRN